MLENIQLLGKYSSVWCHIRLMWAPRYLSMKTDTRFLSRILHISSSAKFWGHEISASDCYHMLFISEWSDVWHRYAFRKLSVGFAQRSLKWLKSIHFNRSISTCFASIRSSVFTYRNKFIPMLIKLDVLQKCECVTFI